MNYRNDLDTIIAYLKPLLKTQDSRYLIGKTQESLKAMLGNVIRNWLNDRDTVGYVRFESLELQNKSEANSRFSSNKVAGLSCLSVAIHNNVGGLEKKSLWLNKVVLERGTYGYKVRTHRARTDPKYLSPLDKDFLAFWTAIMEYINEGLYDKSI